MSAIDDLFAKLRAENRKAFMPFVTAGDPDLGDTYYLHWLNALERILVDSKLAQTNELTDLQKRWHDAALHTPHGQPIVIDRTDRPQ